MTTARDVRKHIQGSTMSEVVSHLAAHGLIVDRSDMLADFMNRQGMNVTVDDKRTSYRPLNTTFRSGGG